MTMNIVRHMSMISPYLSQYRLYGTLRTRKILSDLGQYLLKDAQRIN